MIQTIKSKMVPVTYPNTWWLKTSALCERQLRGGSKVSVRAFHWWNEIKETWRVFVPAAQWTETESKRLRCEDILQGHITTLETQITLLNHVTSC